MGPKTDDVLDMGLDLVGPQIAGSKPDQTARFESTQTTSPHPLWHPDRD